MNKAFVTAAMLAVVVLAFACVGCNRGGQENAAPAAPSAVASLSAIIVLKYAPDPPVALKDTAFTITATGADGKPLSGASVVLDLSMPGMYHGENRPALTETAPGVYEGKGILTMGGGWLARVEVTQGGSAASREFRFDAVDK